MTDIEAQFRVVTPLFCGGADPNRAELRLPSFKGVLRFWWRALAWSRCGGDLERIRNDEAQLFGSAKAGQSAVSMQVEVGSEPKTISKGEVLSAQGGVVEQGARYLGYGVMEAFKSKMKGTEAGELTRNCLDAPIDFTVGLRLKNTEQYEQQLQSLVEALVCMGMLGGMGSKSRKGYGSLVLRSLLVEGEAAWSRPNSSDALCGALKSLLEGRNRPCYAPYTALSAKTRILVIEAEKPNLGPMKLLDHIGRELVRYRSWGHKGKILEGLCAERNFQFDHDLMKLSKGKGHPKRIAFGLPHNYGPKPKDRVEPKNYDRRASPLFIHIHECGHTPVAVLSLIPAEFLPKGESDIRVGTASVPQQLEDELYKPIHEFLDRLTSNPKKPLQAREVKP